MGRGRLISGKEPGKIHDRHGYCLITRCAASTPVAGCVFLRVIIVLTIPWWARVPSILKGVFVHGQFVCHHHIKGTTG